MRMNERTNDDVSLKFMRQFIFMRCIYVVASCSQFLGGWFNFIFRRKVILDILFY